MPFKAAPFKRYNRWVRRKNFQVWIRKHLSHTLAIILAIAVGFREQDEITRLYYNLRNLTKPSLLDVCVLLLAIGTVAAALWELFGNRLATSPQEIRFLRGMRSLLKELEELAFVNRTPDEAEKRFDEFVTGFLRITSSTLCAHKKADAGLMLKIDNDSLRRTHVSRAAKFQVGFEIPIPAEQADEKDGGPGGVSFRRGQLVYMPSVKRWKEAWPLQLTETKHQMGHEDSEDEIYSLTDLPVVCWVPEQEPKHEDFSSMLCVPVGMDQNQKTRYGILEYTTKAKDQFIDRDFMMAECFASILSQAATITSREA